MSFFVKLSAFALIGVFVFSSCGKRRPPLPPVERVPQRVEVNGKQVGDVVSLVWKMPGRNAALGSPLRINRIDVYRLAEQLSEPLSLTEKEFADRSSLIGSVDVNDTDFGFKEMSYPDKIRIVGGSVRLRYAVRLTNASGQKAVFSNFFLIEPVGNVAGAPADLGITVSQKAVTLDWSPPARNLDGTVPVNVLGYNIYRTDNEADTLKLNDKPVTESVYADSTFRFGADYRYFLRTVSIGRNAEEVESFASETVTVSPVDIFEPAAPESLTIAAAPSVISIFFAFNTEPDIAGYKIYRSKDPLLSQEKWQLMTPDLLQTNSYQDTTAESGIAYYYFVVAIDTSGNTSKSSEVVSDTAI